MDQDADAALRAASTLRTRNCGVLSKMIVDFTFEQMQQATLTADGGLIIDILKPGPLVHELFTGFAKKVVQYMTVDDLESESVKFCLLEFLQQTSEHVGQASLMLGKEQSQQDAHALNALGLIQRAVNEAKSVLDGCTVRVRSAEATLAGVRKRRMHSEEARDGEVAGGVIAALAPLTRLLVWLVKHSQLQPVDGEYVHGFFQDMQRLTASLELGASHLSRLIEMNKMLTAGLECQMKNIDQSPVVKKLRVQVQEKTDAYNAKDSQFVQIWNLIGETTLMLTDSKGVILRWNAYGRRLFSMEEQDVLGHNISEFCINGSEVGALLVNLNEAFRLRNFEAHRIEVVLNTKASSVNIMLTLFADVSEEGGCALIWHGVDVTCHQQSIDDLQKRLLASEQENSKLKAKSEKMRSALAAFAEDE